VTDVKWLVAHPDFLQSEAVHNDSGITQFRRVRVVELMDDSFLQCSCVFFARMGLPCKHILRITNTVTATMCHIRWAKQFLFQFGNNARVTDILVTMQRIGQNNMVPVPSSLQLPTADIYPSLLFDTSITDGDTMSFLHRHVEPVPMHQSLMNIMIESLSVADEDDTMANSGFGIEEESVFSPNRRRLQNLPEYAPDEDDYEISFDGTMKICTNLFNVVKHQPNGIAMLHRKLYDLYTEVCAEISSKRPQLPGSEMVSMTVVRGRKPSTRIKSAGL
jgi:hypothetical protein